MPEQPATLEGIPGNAGAACETRECRAARKPTAETAALHI